MRDEGEAYTWSMAAAVVVCERVRLDGMDLMVANIAVLLGFGGRMRRKKFGSYLGTLCAGDVTPPGTLPGTQAHRPLSRY